MEQVTVYLNSIVVTKYPTILRSSRATPVTRITKLSNLSLPSSALKRNTGRVDDAELGI